MQDSDGHPSPDDGRYARLPGTEGALPAWKQSEILAGDALMITKNSSLT